ncbi:MAG: carboxypeptidase regulatory-like domain-containing protein [Planctomycetes bacterium]|nr:carboxypeptidase regulatory-like domain-containing protein [Planctomycetota bacterium]
MICTFRYFLPLSILLTGCAGDDRGLAPVSGTVFFKGKPLPNAGIIFTPDQDNTRVGVGSTDKDGKYKLTSFQINDGAKIGRHTVTIRAYEVPDGPPKAADDITNVTGKMITPFKYARPETSGLTADVARKNNVIDFELTE